MRFLLTWIPSFPAAYYSKSPVALLTGDAPKLGGFAAKRSAGMSVSAAIIPQPMSTPTAAGITAFSAAPILFSQKPTPVH